MLLTFGVQERDDAQLALGHLEGVLQVVPCVRVLQLIKVNQVRPGDKARLLKGGGRSIPHLLGSPSTKQRHWTDSWAEVEGGDRSKGGTAVSTRTWGEGHRACLGFQGGREADSERRLRGTYMRCALYPSSPGVRPSALLSLLPVLVYQGVKGQAILPAGGEVGDIDLGVAVSKRNVKT